MHNLHFVSDRDTRGAAHDHPVLGAVMMRL
jgi:hypothetical protein